MAPSAMLSLTPPQSPHEVQKVSDLTAAAVAHRLAETPLVQDHGYFNHARPLDASTLEFIPTTQPMTVPELDDPIIATGSQCTDHMITCKWSVKNGWSRPRLAQTSHLSLAPTASVLHYATSCFEGLKLYRGDDGRLRLYRPSHNCARMLMSATRISLPAFEPCELEKLIIELVATDGPKWLPRHRAGECLYLRPTMIGSAAGLGIASPKEATLMIFACFMPKYAQPRGLRLLASCDSVRAWPGGFGFAKVGANYGPALMAYEECVARGYDQVLWLLDGLVTEAGASNFFVVWRTAHGRLQLITAPLAGKIILDGITRKSVLELARERLAATDGTATTELEPLETVERDFTMEEVATAAAEGRIVEAFLVGTAYFVTPVSLINYRDKDIAIPMARGDSGAYAHCLKTWIGDIMYGREPDHPWGVVVPEWDGVLA